MVPEWLHLPKCMHQAGDTFRWPIYLNCSNCCDILETIQGVTSWAPSVVCQNYFFNQQICLFFTVLPAGFASLLFYASSEGCEEHYLIGKGDWILLCHHSVQQQAIITPAPVAMTQQGVWDVIASLTSPLLLRSLADPGVPSTRCSAFIASQSQEARSKAGEGRAVLSPDSTGLFWPRQGNWECQTEEPYHCCNRRLTTPGLEALLEVASPTP